MIGRNLGRCTRLSRRGAMNIRTLSSAGAGKYAGQVVVVSGASSGIGEEISLQYARQGANLVLAARRAEKLNDVAARCTAAAAAAGVSGTTKAVVADVSVDDDCRRVVAESVEAFGGIDILVLNAGVGQVRVCVCVSVSVLSDLSVWVSHFDPHSLCTWLSLCPSNCLFSAPPPVSVSL
jgi:NAD(P)-dependent dehydrogenase (short-subunit alcohol dehydrogenase family)